MLAKTTNNNKQIYMYEGKYNYTTTARVFNVLNNPFFVKSSLLSSLTILWDRLYALHVLFCFYENVALVTLANGTPYHKCSIFFQTPFNHLQRKMCGNFLTQFSRPVHYSYVSLIIISSIFQFRN